jgi:dTDP-glucose 4,6-dehydratase
VSNEVTELAVKQVQHGIASINEVRERMNLTSFSGNRVLLTGAGGFAGSHCLEHLLVNTNWQVVCLDSFRHRGKTDRISEVIEAHPMYRNRVTVVTHDLTAPFSTQMTDRIGHIDYIIAYASESHVDRAIEDPVPFVMNNTALVLNTLEYARRVKPEAFVLISTDEVYGALTGDDPYEEWATILPSNPYSASKAAQEAIAISYWRTYGVPLLIVNCMNMIGERQDVEKYVPLVTKACLEGREIVIHGTPDNIGSRHYLHARNLADGILHLLRQRTPVAYTETHTRPDRYNIASPDRVDNLSLAEMIAEYANRKLSYRFEDFPQQRPGHDAHYGLNSDKIFSEGWVPPVDFETSLKKTVSWYLRNPQWLER